MMQRSLFYTSLLILLSFLITGCSGTSKLQERLDVLEKNLQDVRVVHAELTSRIDGVETQARQVTGKVEELEYSQTSQIGGIDGDVGSLKQELSRLGKRIPPPALVPLIALEEDEGRVVAYGGEDSRYLSNGLTRIRTGSYTESLSLFRQLLNISQNRDLAGRALFWVAVSEEGLGNHTGALQVYHQFSQLYSDHPRLPLSLLRQASVFLRLRDTDTARLTLHKLIAQFPSSIEAREAQVKLANLGY